MKTFILLALVASIFNTNPLVGLPAGTVADVPIIMYHALEDSPSNRWEITSEEFEADLAWLSQNGYTSVFMQDVINFVHYGTPLPPKPIVLSFDDGRHPTIEILIPMLEKYDARISMAIVGAFTDSHTKLVGDNPEIFHPHMTWQDVRTAATSGRVEISSHTHNLHGARGAGKTKGETTENYRTRLLADLAQFADALYTNTGLTANTLAYPLGIFNDTSDDIIKEAGYLASLSCAHKTNQVTVGDTQGLFLLNRYLRPPGKPLSSILLDN